jgi:hypothetical protein
MIRRRKTFEFRAIDFGMGSEVLQKLHQGSGDHRLRFCFEAKRHLKAGAAEWRGSDGDSPVVENDDLLHQSQTQAGAVALGSEEGPENALARRGLDTRPAVLYEDAHRFPRAIDFGSNDDDRRQLGVGTRLDGIPDQVCEGLPQQYFVAFELAKLAPDRDVAAEVSRLGAELVGRALANGAQIDG